MVKYFSVDWLAQNHHNSIKDHCVDVDTTLICKPHIPCMVQPNPPPFGKGYLQTKSKFVKRFEYLGPAESFGPQDSPLDSSNRNSPISDVSEYLAGYESDPFSPESVSVGEGSEERKEGGPQRRVRTKFSPEQIKKLERIFIKHKYLDSGEREKTAQKLNLTETQVRTWFQNRRMKLKREVQDYSSPHVPPVIFQPLPPVQYHRMAGHPPYCTATGHPFYPLPVPHLLPHQYIPAHYPHRTLIHEPHFY